VAVSLMEDTAAVLAERGVAAQALLVTVDPARDTPEAMAAAMAEHHPLTLGLTGTEMELARVRELFQVERKLMFEDPELGPIYAHGSHIYLLDPEGAVLTLIPPVVTPERGAEIVMKYVQV
jgi:protein SCO1/2